MIECVLRSQEEYHNVLPGYNTKKKPGRYHGSNFNFKTFGTTQWVVGAYINVDYKSHLVEGLSEEDIIRGCIEYLNQTPPRKKYQKKKPVPLYGQLAELPHHYRFREDEEGTFIETLLITDQRKNKQFWGAGGIGRISRKRGRPRKDEK
tara:strand:+ start:1036 stop:1482 length:447 start_codon:yes stop_codon:yes gene_type:complete